MMPNTQIFISEISLENLLCTTAWNLPRTAQGWIAKAWIVQYALTVVWHSSSELMDKLILHPWMKMNCQLRHIVTPSPKFIFGSKCKNPDANTNEAKSISRSNQLAFHHALKKRVTCSLKRSCIPLFQKWQCLDDSAEDWNCVDRSTKDPFQLKIVGLMSSGCLPQIVISWQRLRQWERARQNRIKNEIMRFIFLLRAFIFNFSSKVLEQICLSN